MALRDQPYFPLYVQDYLTDEKLNACNPSTQGVYIKILCVFHKHDPYGGILLKQKDKQNENKCLNFASKLACHLTFNINVIYDAIIELIDEDVLKIDGDFLYQKRMVNDNELSIKRSKSGLKGGKKTQSKNRNFAKAKTEAKHQANSEYEDENNNVLFIVDNIEDNTIYNFENFWNDYDKKVGDKKKLNKKFDSLSKDDKEKIKEHIQKYKLSQPDKQYRKNPETYLNNKSWNDEIIYKNGITTLSTGATEGSSGQNQTFRSTDTRNARAGLESLRDMSVTILQSNIS